METKNRKLEAQIRKGQELDKVERQLKALFSKAKKESTRNEYRYLYGLLFFQKGNISEAIKIFEEIVATEKPVKAAYLMLGKLYQQMGNTAKALAYLEKAFSVNYQKTYCQKLLIKYCYQTKDFVLVNNYVTSFYENLKPKKLLLMLRIEALAVLGLYHEAIGEYRKLKENMNLKPPEETWLTNLLNKIEKTKYEITYEANCQYFAADGNDYQEYKQVGFKICYFLNREFIYHCDTNRIIQVLDLESLKDLNLGLEDDDALLINNPDNINIFKHLEEVFTDVDSRQYRKRKGAIPVFVVEESISNWQLVLQMYNFNQLGGWHNLHFLIGANEEDLESFFLDEYVPLPNVLYGLNLDRMKNILNNTKIIKDETYHSRLQEVKKNYPHSKNNELQKILLVTSIYNEHLFHYAKILQNVLTQKGYTCLLYKEDSPYFKFTRYTDAKLLMEFQPDLVVHFFGIKEELETYNQIELPIISWLIFVKQLVGRYKQSAVGFKQRAFISGNPQNLDLLAQQGVAREELELINLPIDLSEVDLAPVQPKNALGIMEDLGDLEAIIRKTALRLSSQKPFKVDVNIEVFRELLSSLYFDSYTTYFSHNFSKPDLLVYQQLIATKLARYELSSVPRITKMIAEIFRREVEPALIKQIQIKWLLNEFKDDNLKIYGEGWEKDPALQKSYAGYFDYLDDLSHYRKMVLDNRINIYIGGRINNHSYMQPDLLYGLAFGGFFLVNDLLIKEYGSSLLEPFDHLLVTYSNQEDLVQKVYYYLEHEAERQKIIAKLQHHILKHFSIDKVVRAFLLKGKELLFPSSKLIN